MEQEQKITCKNLAQYRYHTIIQNIRQFRMSSPVQIGLMEFCCISIFQISTGESILQYKFQDSTPHGRTLNERPLFTEL
jgi:hypothetical protein